MPFNPQDAATYLSMSNVSHDGYIRMSLEALIEVSFRHLASEPDSGILADLKLQAVPAQEAGFSEWASTTTPPISLGWSWFIHSRTRRLLPAPEVIRGNVMLIDARGYDVGKMATSLLFATWLALHDWQKTVIDVLDLPIPRHC